MNPLANSSWAAALHQAAAALGTAVAGPPGEQCGVFPVTPRGPRLHMGAAFPHPGLWGSETLSLS